MNEDELEEGAEREPWETDEEEEEETSTETTELPTDAASLQALLAKTREEAEAAAAARVRAEEEEKFNKRRSDLDRSKNQLLENLRANGLDVTEGGKIAPVDPQKAMALFMGTPKAEEKAEDEPFDLYNPDNFQRQLAARDERLRQQTIKDVTAAIAPQLQALSGVALQSQQGNVNKAIAEALAEVGYEGMEETPEFKDFLTSQLQGVSDPVSLSNPQWMAQLALTAIPAMTPTVKQSVREKAEQKRSRERAAAERRENEEARRQMNPSGSSTVRTYAGAEAGGSRKYDRAYDIVKEALGDTGNYDDDINKALAAGKMNELLEKRSKANGTRR